MSRSRPQIAHSDLNYDPVRAPSREDVRAHLIAIFDSSDFVAPLRLRKFLAYVVEEALAGRKNRIKAYSIATEVFGRDANFDVLNDPVVRIEAGRLRRALERYYLLEGSRTPIVIDIPKGSYAPIFGWRAAQASAPLADKRLNRPAIADHRRRGRSPHYGLLQFIAAVIFGIGALYFAIVRSAETKAPSSRSVSILVKPMSSLSPASGAKEFSASLSEEIISRLAQTSNLVIFRSEAFGSVPTIASAARQSKSILFVLEGGVRSVNGDTRVTARLLDDKGAVVWSNAYDADLRQNKGFQLEAIIAAEIAGLAASSALVRSRIIGGDIGRELD